MCCGKVQERLPVSLQALTVFRGLHVKFYIITFLIYIFTLEQLKYVIKQRNLQPCEEKNSSKAVLIGKHSI